MAARFTSARFVGREDAFTRLASVLQAASAGDAGALLIEGTAGVGATRFIDEAVRRVGALQEPMLVIRGGAYGPGTDRPYGPFIRALRPTLAALSDAELEHVTGTAAVELIRLLPELAPRLGERPHERPQTTVPERRQARLLEGVLGVIGRLSELRPVLLVIEDLHRADAATRTLLSFLARIARSQRLAIVGRSSRASPIRISQPAASKVRGPPGSDAPRSAMCGPAPSRSRTRPSTTLA